MKVAGRKGLGALRHNKARGREAQSRVLLRKVSVKSKVREVTPSDGARVGLVLAGRAGLVSRCVASVAFCLRALRPTIR